MSSILLPSTRISQPAWSSNIDWSNPLTDDLCHAAVGFSDRVTDSVFTRNSQILVPTRYGRGVSPPSNTAIGATTPSRLSTSNGVGTGDFTIFFLGAPPAGTERSMPVNNSDGLGGAVYEPYLIINANNAFTATSGLFTFTLSGATGSAAISGAVDGTYKLFAGVRSGGVLTAYANTVSAVGGTNATCISRSTMKFAAGAYVSSGTWGASSYGVVLAGAFNRALSAKAIESLSSNPWQLFRKPQTRIWFDMGAASGGSAVLEGNASGAASASGSLTTGIPIAGAALSVASASGTLAVGIPLAGAAATMSTASGSLTAQITLAGSALAQAVSSALLSSGITMTAAAVAQAAADGTLVTAIQLLGGAQAQAGASGSLTTSTGGLEGNAQASASASASLSTQIRLSGAAIATAGASGSLGGSANLAGTAVSTASASGELTVNIALTAQALASAIATGSLTAQIWLDAAAAAQAGAGAALSGGAGFVLPAARSRTVISTSRRPAALSTSRR